MKLSANYLYDLLPAYYRVIDQERGGPLRALVEILAREGKLVEDNITQLYENWFIETCDEWVVPYIGDLLGVRNIHEVEEAAVFSRRAYVANTVDGTVTVIDVATLSVIDTVTVGTGPLFIDFAANIAIGNIDVRADGCSKDSFLSQIDLYNLVEWSYPQWDVLVFAAPVEYRIYRDAALTDLVAVVPVTEPRSFEDHNL